MTKRAGWWISWSLGALLLAGCAAEQQASADPADDHPTATTATPAPAPTTTTVPPPYSFDGSVPPPELINTGTDYDAIYRSLDDYGRWIEAHSPNVDLASDVYVVGTPTYQGFVDDIAVLNENRWRLVDVDKSVSVSVVQSDGQVASLRVAEQVARLEARDESGTVRESQSFGRSLNWLVLLSADAVGRWRIATVDPTERSN